MVFEGARPEVADVLLCASRMCAEVVSHVTLASSTRMCGCSLWKVLSKLIDASFSSSSQAVLGIVAQDLSPQVAEALAFQWALSLACDLCFWDVHIKTSLL